jgi:hypothetical protein
MYDKPQPVFYGKSSTFLSWVRSWIVCMNNEFSLIGLRVARQQCRGSIITVVPGIKILPFGSASTNRDLNGFHGIVGIIFGS